MLKHLGQVVLFFDEDKVMTIYELLELANKMYGVYIRHEVVFNNGKFSGVMIRIVNVISGVKIKADNLILEDLVINDSSKESVNKAIYHPKASNLFFKGYLLYIICKQMVQLLKIITAH